MNRQEELDKLLEKLEKADTNNYSDVDLLLTYLENYLADPAIAGPGGGSSKLLEMEITPSIDKYETTYKITWKKIYT